MSLSPAAEFITFDTLRQRLARPGANSAEILRTSIHSNEGRFSLESFRSEEVFEFMDILDNAMESDDATGVIFQELRNLCGRTGLLPPSHFLRDSLEKLGDQPIAGGGFGDVWKGTYRGRTVAIKTLRVLDRDDLEKARRKFCKEVVVWKRLRHRNIVPFLGASITPGALTMVSEWMSQGTIRHYVRANPDADRIRLLLDIVGGLSYLHSSNVLHGDLKGDNILVDGEGKACLCDFGLTAVASSLHGNMTSSCMSGSIRWMAPELFDLDHEGPEATRPSQSSDIYALGMVVMEVFTGKLPYYDQRNDSRVLLQLMNGTRPKRPPETIALGFSDSLWEVVQNCWDFDKTRRPSASYFLTKLHHAVGIQPWTQGAAKQAMTALLYALSSKKDYFPPLYGQEAQDFVDALDQVVDSVDVDEELSRRSLCALTRACGQTGLLPVSYNLLRGRLRKASDLPFAVGRYADVWEGSCDNLPVRMKILKVNAAHDSKKFKAEFCQGALKWKRMQHENILPFIGVSDSLAPMCIVTPWMEQNVVKYANDKPAAVRVKLLTDVSRGLAYLHSQAVVHGNLKGANVLVNSDGTACLSDFGLDRLLRGNFVETLPELATWFNARWSAPELFDSKTDSSESSSSPASDVYSFAMVAIEIFTGLEPFHGYRKEGVILRVMQGKRPERPQEPTAVRLADSIWELVQRCWEQDPKARPTTFEVLHSLCGGSDPEVIKLKPRIIGDDMSSHQMQGSGEMSNMYDSGRGPPKQSPSSFGTRPSLSFMRYLSRDSVSSSATAVGTPYEAPTPTFWSTTESEVETPLRTFSVYRPDVSTGMSGLSRNVLDTGRSRLQTTKQVSLELSSHLAKLIATSLDHMKSLLLLMAQLGGYLLLAFPFVFWGYYTLSLIAFVFLVAPLSEKEWSKAVLWSWLCFRAAEYTALSDVTTKALVLACFILPLSLLQLGYVPPVVIGAGLILYGVPSGYSAVYGENPGIMLWILIIVFVFFVEVKDLHTFLAFLRPGTHPLLPLYALRMTSVSKAPWMLSSGCLAVAGPFILSRLGVIHPGFALFSFSGGAWFFCGIGLAYLWKSDSVVSTVVNLISVIVHSMTSSYTPILVSAIYLLLVFSILFEFVIRVFSGVWYATSFLSALVFLGRFSWLILAYCW